ncbi:MAG: phosphate signaling complex protein PhoU [Deltaproteobacteria bacterium]|nr:phosphate signaling complex protein PhoU [Deltaproteobacteria bacterium]NCP01925.1 phosphate signaling complex protein PhoU [Deltaproteobacteria bacterium]
MTVLMSRELDALKKRLLALSAVVESKFAQAIQALLERDVPLAQKVAMGDKEVDALEVALEEECLKVLALHQPVATDLRLIVSILKMNNDLERMADLAVNIAKRSIDLSGSRQNSAPYDLEQMSNMVQQMLKMSLDALVQRNAQKALDTIKLDDEVDVLHRDNFTRVKEAIRKNPAQMDDLILYLSFSRYLERIADLATNIAEDVVYLISGEIIRHENLS